MIRFQSKKVYLGIAVIALFALALASCDNGAGDDTVEYRSTKDGVSYVLKIIKNTGKAAFVPRSGDTYKLIITKADGTAYNSTGTVQSYSDGVFTLEHSSGKTFTVKGTDDGLMTEIKGSIPVDGGTQIDMPAPGVVDVNMVGTTWKSEQEVDYNGSKAKETTVATFSDSTATWITTIGKDVYKGSGAYSVKGTTVTCRIDSAEGGYPIVGAVYVVEVINGNTINFDGRTFYKQ